MEPLDGSWALPIGSRPLGSVLGSSWDKGLGIGELRRRGGGSQKSREGDVCCILSYLGHGCASREQLLPAYSTPPSPHQTGTAIPSPTASHGHSHDLQCRPLTPAHSRGHLPTQPRTGHGSGRWPQSLPEALGEAHSAPSSTGRVTALGQAQSHTTQEGTQRPRKITAVGTAGKSQALGDTGLEDTLIHTPQPHTHAHTPRSLVYTPTATYPYTHTDTRSHVHTHTILPSLTFTHLKLTCIHTHSHPLTHSCPCSHSHTHSYTLPYHTHLYTHSHPQTQIDTYIHMFTFTHTHTPPETTQTQRIIRRNTNANRSLSHLQT